MIVYDLTRHPLGWQVRRRDRRLASAVRSTRESAFAFAERLAKASRPATIVVFDEAGDVEVEVVYGALSATP